MTPDTFFEKFELFADAPNAVARMRELVRRLAVTGRLIPQSRNDAPADDLIKSIRVERESAVQQGSIKAMRALPPVEAKDLPYSIRPNWKLVRLGDLVLELQTGPFGSTLHKSDYRIGGTPVINPASFKDGRIEPIEEMAVDDATVERLSTYKLEAGDILVARRGEMGRCAVVTARETKWLCGTGSLIMRMPKAPHGSFLSLLISSPVARAYLSGKSVGTTMQSLNHSILARMPVGVPPLAEQMRIVAKVDELMALCDSLEAQQHERETRHATLARASLARFAAAPTPANLDFLFHNSYTITPADLRKSILTLAVQGKLVSQHPNEESVEFSLANNDEQRRETAQHDHRADEENQPLLSSDDRWEIADGWSWRGLADLVLFIDYRGKTPVKVSSGVRLLTAKNVRKGQINLSPEEYLSETDYHTWMTRGFPKVGDILFTTEAPMGNAAVVELTERFALAQRVICFQSYGAIDPEFLVLQILSDEFQFILDKNGTGVTAKGIKASKLKQLPIALPPFAEQRRIVAKVDQLMALVDQLETQLAASRTTAEKLLEAVVHELTFSPVAINVSSPPSTPTQVVSSPSQSPDRRFVRAVLSAEIVHRLHGQPTFGQVKHQKILHLCEHIAELENIEGSYRRMAAGPFDKELIQSNEAELAKRQWYQEAKREKFGHVYRPLRNAGGHTEHLKAIWPTKVERIRALIEMMRHWDTDKCEIFSTLYAAWNDLLIWGQQPTEDAILHEIFDRWHPVKKRFPRKRWTQILTWMRDQQFMPTGFGKPTVTPE